MKKILITRKLIKSSEEYAQKVFNTKLNEKDKLLTKDEIIQKSGDCDGILSSITDKFDENLILKLEPNTNVKIINPAIDEQTREALENMKNYDGIIYETGWYKNFNNSEIFYGSNRPKIPEKLVKEVIKTDAKFFGCDLDFEKQIGK